MTRAVHQFLPSMARGDAIGNHTLALRAVLREAGVASDVFAEEVHPNARGEAHPYTDYDRVGGDREATLLYHSSTGSSMADHLRSRPNPLFVDYHNVTEPRFFERWEPVAAQRARDARSQLEQLGPVTAMAIAHSDYSAQELRATGFGVVLVLPLLLDFSHLDVAPDARVVARLAQESSAGGTRWLFVGRVAPNKCVHDLIASFAVYRHGVDANARLTIVGGMMSARYRRALDDLIAELDVGTAIEFADHVPLAVLIAHYRAADVFVSVSEHEGFMVPVVEALYLGIPVVAFASTAVPETVGDAGLLLADKDPVIVAAAVDRIATDVALRDKLVAAGRARVRDFAPDVVAPRWLELLVNGH